MIIHVVRSGETLFSIARDYGVPVSILQNNNEIGEETKLVVGQTIVVQIPEVIHTVQRGETLSQIAQEYQTDVMTLLQNNPGIPNPEELQVGMQLVIRYQESPIGRIATNGYTYPYIERDTLSRTLPYLSYLTVFTYGFTPEGELISTDDSAVLRAAKEYGVAPVMLLSTLSEQGSFSNELSHQLLNHTEIQERLMDQIVENMENKGYYGLDVDFEYIYPQDREAYIRFIQRLRERLKPQGYFIMVALAPKTSADQPGLLYEAHDYAGLGAAADYVLLMTYEWGYAYGPPMAVAPLNKVREVLDYAITEIPPEKILMGIPNYGYDWTLPYIRGESRARSLGNVEAVNQAAQVGAVIQFDELAQSPYYIYYDAEGREHIVWFEDARSIEAKLQTAAFYGFYGVGYWNIMKFFPQNWLVLNSLFMIDKIE